MLKYAMPNSQKYTPPPMLFQYFCTVVVIRNFFLSLPYLFYEKYFFLLFIDVASIDEQDTRVHFVCGLNAGLMASLVTHPFDVVKTQMQLYPSKYRGTAHCINVIFTEYGLSGFMRGVTPRCLRRTLISALSWTVFEEIMKHLKLKI